MILGVTGTNGSGKGSVVEYLKTKGFVAYSARNFIVEEIQKRGLLADRPTMREVANDLRKIHGPAYIVETLYNRAVEEGGDAVIESIREVAGGTFLKEQGALLISVDADKRLRYERVVSRGSTTDKVSFEEFSAQEDREMSAPDEWDMNVFGVMDMSDFVIHNDGSVDGLHAQIDAMLTEIRR